MTRGFRIGVVACLTAIGTLALVAGAHGATRHAAPTGSGATCSAAAPCAITTAIESAAPGDEISVADGTYTLPAAVTARSSNLDIHGQPNSPPSMSSGAILRFSGGGLAVSGNGIRLRGLALIGQSGATSAPLTVTGAGVDVTRVMAIAVLQPACSVQGANVRMTYVMCFSFAGHGLEVRWGDGTTAGRFQQMLAIGDGSGGTDSAGIRIETSGAGRFDATVLNTVARGGAPTLDVVTQTSGTSRSSVSVRSTNFRDRTVGARSSITAPTSANLNQTADPRLAFGVGANGAWDGSLRPQADSPLIDRGSILDVGNTSSDLGNGLTPRGSSRDIGAYEYDSGLSPIAPGATVPPPAEMGLPTPAPVATAAAAGADPAAGSDPGADSAFSVTRARLTVQPRTVRVRSRATVPAAGRVTQRVTVGRGSKRRTLCTVRAEARAAGAVPLTCVMRRAARDQLRRATQRYTITTTFAVGADRTVSTQRLVAKRRR